MRNLRTKIIEAWIVTIVFIVTLALMGHIDLYKYSAFGVMMIYLLINHKALSAIQQHAPNPVRLLYSSPILLILAVFYIISILGVSLYFIATDRDLGSYISSAGHLFLLLSPIAAPMLVSHYLYYRELGQ